MLSRNSLRLPICLIVFGMLTAGCVSGAGTPGATSTPGGPGQATSSTPKPASETPKYGGIFTSFIAGGPPSLDGQQETTINTSQIVAPIYSTIVQADPVNVDKWSPGLAERWSMSEDGTTWTFDIRQGVKWHDGTLFTVDDAVFNMKRLTNPPKGIISNVASLLQPVVKSIDKDGNKLKVGLKYPFAPMLETIGSNYSPIFSEKYLGTSSDMKTAAMGTGPFKLKSYTPGLSLEGIKNPDFWIKGRPYLDGYRFLIMSDPSTRLSAFRTGKVNMTGKWLGSIPPSAMEIAKKGNADLKFYPDPNVAGSWFFMNVRKPPFQDQRVRRAVSLVLDRQAALKVLAEGHGTIGKPFPRQPWGIPEDEILRMPGFAQPKDKDIAQARSLMQTAGYPDGFELTILARNVLQSKDSAVFMTNQLAQLGIRAKVSVLEDAIFWDTGRKAGHEAMVYLLGSIVGDPYWLSRGWAPGGTLNFSGNDGDTVLTQMNEEQIKIVDIEKRKAVIRRIEEHLLEALPAAPIVWPYSYIGVQPTVRGFAPGFSSFVGNTLEEIWLDK